MVRTSKCSFCISPLMWARVYWFPLLTYICTFPFPQLKLKSELFVLQGQPFLQGVANFPLGKSLAWKTFQEEFFLSLLAVGTTGRWLQAVEWEGAVIEVVPRPSPPPYRLDHPEYRRSGASMEREGWKVCGTAILTTAPPVPLDDLPASLVLVRGWLQRVKLFPYVQNKNRVCSLWQPLLDPAAAATFVFQGAPTCAQHTHVFVCASM